MEVEVRRRKIRLFGRMWEKRRVVSFRGSFKRDCRVV